MAAPKPVRRPQINFQVDDAMKLMYEEAKLQGHWVTRLCAAGLLMMIENPRARTQAMARLREWEGRYSDASPEQIRRFVEGAGAALQAPAPDTPPAPPAPRRRKKGGQAGSE
ncbi:MAG: hypothetical protein SF069_01390 [Phycisphaerae bacterium]|jgi:hypothetical protein|nr:hypothetical protein [Phycisphaerae bacterium]